MFTLAFWKAATERALKTGAQFALVTLGVGLFAGTQPGETAEVLNAFTVDWLTLGGVFLGGGLVSYLTSIISAPFGNGGPSLANEEVVPDVADPA